MTDEIQAIEALQDNAPLKPHRSHSAEVWLQFRQHKGALIGGAFILFITLFVLIGPWIWQVDPGKLDIRAKDYRPIYTAIWDSEARVSWAHPLGSDQLGRDGLANMIYGGRTSMAVGWAAMLLALFLGAAFLILGLAGLGGLQRLQTTLEFRVGECLVTLATLGVLRRCRLSARLGHDHALALRFHDDAFGAPARKALVHAAGPRTTREAKGFFSVLIAHATPSSFPADPPPSALRRPCSFAAPSTTRGERPPAASAPCITL